MTLMASDWVEIVLGCATAFNRREDACCDGSPRGLITEAATAAMLPRVLAKLQSR